MKNCGLEHIITEDLRKRADSIFETLNEAKRALKEKGMHNTARAIDQNSLSLAISMFIDALTRNPLEYKITTGSCRIDITIYGNPEREGLEIEVKVAEGEGSINWKQVADMLEDACRIDPGGLGIIYYFPFAGVKHTSNGVRIYLDAKNTLRMADENPFHLEEFLRECLQTIIKGILYS